MKTAQAWPAEIRRITEALVAISSISPDMDGENRCANQLAAFLNEGTALDPQLWPTGDGRHNVACLLRGEHPANQGSTLILMGHYDTVGIDEFRAIDPPGGGSIALRPADLKAALLERGDFPEDDPSQWMVGRGVLDMKSGLATLIVVLRALWHERSQLAGNLLLLACPDEENQSAGILSALPRLVTLRDEQQLEYSGLLNADYTAPRGDDPDARYVYSGTVGKLLPSFYIIGDPTHVGEPFRGVDANQLAAELVRRVNLNVTLSDHWPGDEQQSAEWAVPPMTLGLRDLKPGYNVQTAAEAFVYVNWLTHTRSPATALQLMMGEARAAIGETLRRRDQQYAQFAGDEPTPPAYGDDGIGGAFDFGYLCEMVEASGVADDWLDTLVAEVGSSAAQGIYSRDIDSRDLSMLVVRRVAQMAGMRGPAIVVFFAPPYYPHIQPQSNQLTRAVESVIAAYPQIQMRGFFPYISDISYLRLESGIQSELASLQSNMPLLGRGYDLDFAAMAQLDCAVVNIGPFGKDAHGLYERVHMPYSFEVVPQIIYEVALKLLATR